MSRPHLHSSFLELDIGDLCQSSVEFEVGKNMQNYTTIPKANKYIAFSIQYNQSETSGHEQIDNAYQINDA